MVRATEATLMVPQCRVLVLYENGGHHIAFSQRARIWLDRLAANSGFDADCIQNTDTLDDALLSRYALFIQLDYPPYGWKEQAVTAFERYISEGKGGWIGFHHASLLGEFDGFPLWQWYSQFLGDITYVNYIPTFAQGTVHVEETGHPVMEGVPASFRIEKEEWYTYNRSPRPNVDVLASVDEATYRPDTTIKMGDHPVVWTNRNVPARNLYIFMGHSPELFDNTAYTTLVRNAIFWAAGR
jgi:type 1 glutamine amidotransferase